MLISKSTDGGLKRRFFTATALSVAVIFVFQNMNRECIHGYVRNAEYVPSLGQTVIEVGTLFQETAYAAISTPSYNLAHRWIAAKGIPSPVGDYMLVHCDASYAAGPIIARDSFEEMGQWLQAFLGLLSKEFFAGLAVFLLVLGYWAIRLLGGVLAGLLMVMMSWNIFVLPFQNGSEYGGWFLLAILLAAFYVGLQVGANQKGILSFFVQRTGLILMAWLLSGPISEWTGTSLNGMRIFLCLIGLLSPPAMIAVATSFLMCMALEWSGERAWYVLAGSAVLVHILTRGRWIPSLYRKKSVGIRPHPNSGEIALEDVLFQRGK